jgi:hypothetical protein
MRWWLYHFLQSAVEVACLLAFVLQAGVQQFGSDVCGFGRSPVSL